MDINFVWRYYRMYYSIIIMMSSITQEKLWATQAVTSQEVVGRLRDGFQLVTYPCPPGYCRCTLVPYQETTTTCKYVYDSSQQDSQCHCDRGGMYLYIV